MTRMKELYEKEVAPALMKKFEYKSVMQVPKLEKIVINIGLGDLKENLLIDNLEDIVMLNRYDVEGITDEIFAVAAMERGRISTRFMYGLITLPYIGWALGTALGVYANQILPQSVCGALGIAIYSMFIAIIIPPSRDDKGVLAAVLMK